jgi:hypothetical protein
VAIVVGAIIVGLVLALAAVVVLREQRRWVVAPPPAVFDIDDAVSWVAKRLPDAVTAQLSYDDVRVIIELQVAYFSRAGSSSNGSSATPPAPFVVGSSETVAFILDQTLGRPEPFTPEQVHAVVEAQLAYLREIGAVGGPAERGDRGDQGDRGAEPMADE